MAVKMTKSAGPSWAKKGKAAAAAVEKEDAKVQQKMEQQGKLRRVWMPPGAESQFTFLDGNLDADGVLDCMVFHEHNVYMNGNWRNWFVCTQDNEPCPICEGGDEPYLCGLFTVIDHSEFEYNGKTYKNQKRILAAKRNTLKLLQKIAAKRGGLAGCTFDVSRTGAKSPAVGDMYDFSEKRTIAQLKKAHPDVEDWSPADYEKEIVYRPAAELRSIGFGTSSVIGGEAPMDDGDDPDDDL